MPNKWVSFFYVGDHVPFFFDVCVHVTFFFYVCDAGAEQKRFAPHTVRTDDDGRSHQMTHMIEQSATSRSQHCANVNAHAIVRNFSRCDAVLHANV